MNILFDSGKLICLFLLTVATAVSSQDLVCPFSYLYHFGDGFTDTGNSINVDPKAPNPARLLPYGMTYPGWPSGRWCDGRVSFDNEAIDMGLPNIVPYLTSRAATTNDGVIFSVARSPVLPFSFFESRGIDIPSYAAPLRTQYCWFREYLKSVCSTPEECADHLASSFVILGNVEGNDVGYALTQGKSIEEVKTYVPYIVEEQIIVTRELIASGATLLAIPGNGPVGCNPYILTALFTHDRDGKAYDELGCLNSVNELILYKNSVLEQAVTDLQAEYPNITISYAGAIFDAIRSVINETSVIVKSIEEVKTYVPYIVEEQIIVTRELIASGATLLAIAGNEPVGCNPYILTALFTHDRDGKAYDELGCLNSVNELILYKNSVLEQAVTDLQAEYPNITISYAGAIFDAIRSVINETSVIGPDGINKALTCCCGVGGRYNYDSNKFCGSSGVPVCSNPNEYVFWDGFHSTQQSYYRLEPILSWPALAGLGCVPRASVQSDIMSKI